MKKLLRQYSFGFLFLFTTLFFIASWNYIGFDFIKSHIKGIKDGFKHKI